MDSKTITLKPYDEDAANDVFSILFHGSDIERPDGYTEIPAVSYQLVVSALEWIMWETSGQARDDLKHAKWVVEKLRDEQKKREWQRKDKTKV